jgi:hypothetical protein
MTAQRFHTRTHPRDLRAEVTALQA